MASQTPAPANLASLRQDFGRRDKWWETVISRAEAARGTHKNLLEGQRENLSVIETLISGFSAARDIAGKYGRAPHGNLEVYYKDRAGFEKDALDPLRGIRMASAVSRNRSAFWGKNADLMIDGQHKKVLKRLDRAESFFNRAYIRLRYGGSALEQWRDDIASARAALPKHETVLGKLRTIDARIDQGESATVDALYKIVKNRDLQKIIVNSPSFSQQAERDEILRPFLEWSLRDFKVSKEDARTEIKKLRGRMTPAKLEQAFDIRAQRAEQKLEPAMDACRMAEHRLKYCGEFIRSAKAARSMEIKRSLIVGGISMDLKGALDAASGGAPDLAHTASIKMRRWVNPKEVEEKLKLMEKPDFTPADVDPLPRLDYVCNATSDSFRRVVGNPVKNMLSSAWRGTQRGLSAAARTVLPGRQHNP